MTESDASALQHRRPLLIVFSGLPGTGKTTLSKALAQVLHAAYLRIDTIEQTLREHMSASQPVNEEGYCVAYALAEENLRLGQVVLADAVNACAESRDAWMAVAERAN